MSKISVLLNKLCANGVPYKTLGELGVFYGGLSGKGKDDFKDGNENFITYVNVFNNPELNLHDDAKVRIYQDEKQRRLKYLDVIFTGSSETPDECAFSSVVCEEPPADFYLNSFCFVWEINDKHLFNPHFLKHLFRSYELRKQLIKTASGVTRFNVSKEKMKKVLIPVPPMEIQNEIVKILDVFTDLNSALSQELLLRRKQYSFYYETLLNFENLSEEKIDYLPLYEVASFMNGKGHEQSINENGKYIVINSKFISTLGQVKKFTDKQICPVYVGDILMVMSDLPNGKALAKCFLVDADDRYSLNQRICSLTNKVPDRIITKFLYYVLNRNRQLLRYDNGVDQTNLRKEDILNISIPIPSIQTQQRIVHILDCFDTISYDLDLGLPAEISSRQKQYEYYRDNLLTFKELKA